MSRLILFLTIFVNSCVYSQGRLPILAFSGVQTGNVNDFIMLKNAGFNISLDVYKNTNDAIRNLDAANKVGIKLFIYSDSLMLQPDKIINRIKDHPAFYGTYVSDEPSSEQFPMVKWRIEGIKKFDKKGKFYVNLFPNEASSKNLGTTSYQNYLKKYVEVVQPDFISFDYYPIKFKKVDLAWYNNLEEIRKISLQINKPFWAFANSTIFGPHSEPTLAGLKLQQFGNLLYGAKGLQYFTYWTQDKKFRDENNFEYSIVYEDGRPSPTYDIVKQLNSQIRNLEWIFMGSEVEKIYHDGKSVPQGTTKMVNFPEYFREFNTSKESIMLSILENSQNRFLIIQNKDIYRSIQFQFKAADKINIINSQSGKQEGSVRNLNSANILPGDLLIFTFKK